ncbi:sensor histidine kinase [Magnetococcales bacterium HHB-1]
MADVSLTDDALIAELKKRFDHTKQTLYDLQMVTKKLEAVNKKLEQSEKVKSTFVSHVKNEINNPLTSILGLSQQMRSLIRSNPEVVENIADTIYSEAFSLDFQLRNIFAAAEIESGDTDLHVSNTDVYSLINEAVDTFAHQIKQKELTINLPTPPEFTQYFKTDPERLQLIFHNLISNAIEFNKQQGTITIKANLEDGQFFMTITDTGVGLSPEDSKKIFDRFQQIESGTTKTHKGHGLGLSIIKALLDLLEGHITVACELKQGCSFSLKIPEVETDVSADAFAIDGNEFFFDDDQIEAF